MKLEAGKYYRTYGLCFEDLENHPDDPYAKGQKAYISTILQNPFCPKTKVAIGFIEGTDRFAYCWEVETGKLAEDPDLEALSGEWIKEEWDDVLSTVKKLEVQIKQLRSTNAKDDVLSELKMLEAKLARLLMLTEIP